MINERNLIKQIQRRKYVHPDTDKGEKLNEVLDSFICLIEETAEKEKSKEKRKQAILTISIFAGLTILLNLGLYAVMFYGFKISLIYGIIIMLSINMIFIPCLVKIYLIFD